MQANSSTRRVEAPGVAEHGVHLSAEEHDQIAARPAGSLVDTSDTQHRNLKACPLLWAEAMLGSAMAHFIDVGRC
jgi:hypothetical protein